MKKIIIISLATLAGWGILFLLAAKQSQELDSMDEFEFDYDEGSDIDNWEDEQVFQDEVQERMEEDEDDWDKGFDWKEEQEEAFREDDLNKRQEEDDEALERQACEGWEDDLYEDNPNEKPLPPVQ